MTSGAHHIRCFTGPALNSLSFGAAVLRAVLLIALVAPLMATAAEPPGTVIRIDPATLPEPFTSESATNGPTPVARMRDMVPDVPPGFTVGIFAEGLESARNLIVAPDGAVLVAEQEVGRITEISRDGTQQDTLLTGFDSPYGMAVQGGFLYIADLERVWRVPYPVAGQRPEPVTSVGSLGEGRGHITRSLVFAGDGKSFFVGIGSRSNIAEDPPLRATIQRFAADGSGQRDFATGLRNPVGLAIQPQTGALFAAINERDTLGDGLVPDYLTEIHDGGFYGWPYSYLGRHPQPGFAERRPDLVARAIVPDVLFRAHSAPLGLVFYSGDAFPAEYRGGAFVALHGSWNAHVPSGYSVAFVPFKDGRPTGAYQVFASGFQVGSAGDSRAWGRPAAVAVAVDGSLLIADDLGGRIWRVSTAKRK